MAAIPRDLTIGDYAYELDPFGEGQYATVHRARHAARPDDVLALKKIGKKKL